MPKVTIIIPNYNGVQFLKKCLPSVMNQTFTDFDIILVDNGSDDTSTSYVQNTYPQIRQLLLSENKGFSAAVNIGIKHTDAPYVLLLNTDTILHPAFLSQMLLTIEQSPDIFSVSSRMLRMDDPSRIDSAGDLYTICGYAVCRGRSRQSRHYRKKALVFSACAGAALYRRDMVQQLGYFDSRFFAYLEDVDLGYRARISGLQNVYCPTASVLHVGSGTTGHRYTPFKVYHSTRNNLFLLKKNQTTLQLFLNFPFITAGFLLRYLYFKKRGLGSAYISGFTDGLKQSPSFQKFPRTFSQICSSWKLEVELIFNTFLYLKDFLITHLSDF